jgi:hypothetical protein
MIKYEVAAAAKAIRQICSLGNLSRKKQADRQKSLGKIRLGANIAHKSTTQPSMEQVTPPLDETAQTEPSPKPICLNCDKKMPRKAGFCPHCGQRNNLGRVTMRELVERLWIAVMHLDGKLVKSLRDVVMPARITTQYFMGRQKRYFNPIRFFGVVMLFFLLVLRHYDFDRDEPTLDSDQSIGISSNDPGSASINFGGSEDNATYYHLLSDYGALNQIKTEYGKLDTSLKAQIALPALDSLLFHAFPKLYRTDNTDDSMSVNERFASLDSMNISLGGVKSYRIAGKDVLRCTPQEIFEKYSISSRLDQLLVTQSIKTIKDPKALMYAYLGSFTWTILVMVAVMSLILSLFYKRQKRLYVEHFLFLLHGHCGVLLPLGIVMAIDQYIYRLPSWVFLVLGVLIVVYTFLAMYRYYGQSLLRTFGKWVTFNFCYFLLFTFCMILSMVVVFFLY